MVNGYVPLGGTNCSEWMGIRMFFKSKKKSKARVNDDAQALKEELDAAIIPELKTQEKKIVEDAVKQNAKATPVKSEQKANFEPPKIDNMRLFPGFEDQPFEIGYASCSAPSMGIVDNAPMLVMRWKTNASEADWFPVPPMFNKVVLARIHEREQDLDRLLLDYGYDAEQLTSARPSQK